MAIGPWLFTNTTRPKILDGTFASGSSWKVALFLSTSNIGANSTSYASLTNEHANASGYVTGGIAVTASIVGTTSAEWRFAFNPTWTASGGNILARYAVLYKVAGDVFAYCFLDTAPADVTISSGQTLTLDSDGAPGPVATLA